MSEMDTRRKTWGPGPWDEEPDRVEWRDPLTGLPCLIVRGPVGALCGYVGVYPGHPFYGQEYGFTCKDCDAWNDTDGNEYRSCTHCPDDKVNVHGGLTYSGACQGDICHVAAEGELEPWWFGFDCAHAYDLVPSYRMDTRLWKDGSYRDLTYVKAEVTSLARQLKDLA